MKGSDLIKSLVVESKKNELVNISCLSRVEKKDLDYSVLDFDEEKDYYKKIRNNFFNKIFKECSGINTAKPQTESSRRFIYTDDSCISMIHLLFRDNKIDLDVTMRSSNVVRTLWADYEFLKIIAYEAAEELQFKHVPIYLNLKIRSAHIVP